MAEAIFSPLLTEAFSFPRFPLRLRPSLSQKFNEGAKFLIFDMLSVIVAMMSAIYYHSSLHAGKSNFSYLLTIAVVVGPGAWVAAYWDNVYKGMETSITEKIKNM